MSSVDRPEWKSVPVEPTANQLLAAFLLSEKMNGMACGDDYYRAMIAAAPVDRPALAGAQDERAAFEAEYRKRYAVPAHADHLTFPDAARAWEWWQARAALDGGKA